MTEALNFFAKFTNETLFLLVWLALGTATGLILYWVNRRKRGEVFTHEVPFQVVDNYLRSDSSTPSSAGRTLSETVGGGAPVSLEEKRLQNEVMALTLKIQEQTTLITQLSAGGGSPEVSLENAKLKQQLEELKLSGGGAGGEVNPDMQRELDALKNKLKEYEIIEDDLANLKELQDENRQLKEQLSSGAPQAETVAEAPTQAPEAVIEEVAEASTEIPEPVIEETPVEEVDVTQLEQMAEETAPSPKIETQEEEVTEASNIVMEEEPAEEDQSASPSFEAAEEVAAVEEVTPEEEENLSQIEKDGEEKSAEELLSEFEKMLG